MKTISHWASRHIALSRFILIVLGCINFLSGILLGITFLKETPLWLTNLLGLGIVCLIFFLEKKYRQRKMTTPTESSYQHRTKTMMGFYFCNFLLAFGLGQVLLNHAQDFNKQNSSYTVLKSVVEPTIPSVLPRSALSDNSSIAKTSAIKKQKKINKISFWIAKKVAKWQHKMTGENGSTHIYGVWMLLLGIFSAVASAPLACGLSCGGAPALAIAVLLIGLGCLVGGIYLVVKYGYKGEAKSKNDRSLQTALWITSIALIVGYIIAAVSGN